MKIALPPKIWIPIIIFAIVILAGGVLVYQYWWLPKNVDLSPIKDSEIKIKQLETRMYGCMEPSPSLITRCKMAGGVLTTMTTSIGFGVVGTSGCYPEGKTNDAGKKCKSDNECQGDCIWLAGDVINDDSSSTCSEHKTPLFIYKNSKPNSGFCSDIKEEKCSDKKQSDRNDCYYRAADMLKDKQYCYKITWEVQKNGCLENLAGKLGNKEYCKEVSNPIGYCLYLSAIEQNNILKCSSIESNSWRGYCYKEIGIKSGKGVGVCDDLTGAYFSADFYIDICRKVMTGTDPLTL